VYVCGRVLSGRVLTEPSRRDYMANIDLGGARKDLVSDYPGPRWAQVTVFAFITSPQL